MIKFENVSKSFGSNTVLDDFNLEIKKGSIFGLVGINGAGKSTMLRILTGIYSTDSGLVTIGGESVHENPKVKGKIFFLPDDPYYSYNLTGEDLKNLYKSFYDLDEKTFYKHLKSFKLDSNTSIHNYSKRQLFMSLALSLNPEYMFLDEAFDGLDPLARLYFKKALIDLSSRKNTTIIISSHALRELEDICDSYGLIDHKTIIGGGDLNDSLASIFKYQLSLTDFISKEMIKSVHIINYETEGKLIKITFKGNEQDFLDEINKYRPVFIDKIAVNFEDLFMEEVEARGYLKWDTLKIIIKRWLCQLCF